jgi:hypothetical protein
VAELCHNHRQPSTNNGKTPGQICILTPDGELIEKRIVTERMRFAAVFGSRPRARILIEASTESEWVARCLEELGHEVVVADPDYTPMYGTGIVESRRTAGTRGPWPRLAATGSTGQRIEPPTSVVTYVDDWRSAKRWCGPGRGTSR